MKDEQGFEFGVQSYSFCDVARSTEQTIAAVKACGLAAVELWQGHLDVFSRPDVEGELAKYRQAGVTVASCGVYALGQDETKTRTILHFARTAGIKAVSCALPWDGTPRSLALAERLAEEYGVRLAQHNHGRLDPTGATWTLETILKAGSDRIGLCFDVGWMLDSGENPVPFIEKWFDRIYGLHFRDCIFDRAGKFIDVVPGTGNLDLAGLFTLLGARGYAGYASIEYAGPAPDPVGAVKERADALKAFLK
jgi:sugar phosphate isomerase/epimerase